MQWSGNKNSGFYLDDFGKLADILQKNVRNKQKTILTGVSFALMDFAEKHNIDLHEMTIIETGGMRGRRTK